MVVNKKKRRELLEKAFGAEVAAAIQGGPRLMQTRAIKAADALVAEGYLRKSTESYRHGGGVFGVTVEGYELTHLGRLEYCSQCV